MTPDFWSSYISGAVGICVGNPLDIIKVRLQSGQWHASTAVSRTRTTVFSEARNLTGAGTTGIGSSLLKGMAWLNISLFPSFYLIES